MKPIACLIILSLIFAFWSSGSADLGVRAGLEDDTGCSSLTVFEQLQRDPVSTPLRWAWDMWVELVFPSRRRRRRKVRRRCKYKPGKLELVRRQCRRWFRRWRRLWRQWQELVVGAVQMRAIVPEPPAVCVEETPVVGSNVGPQGLYTSAPPSKVVGEANPTTKRGPGRPRTIPTAHKCCPNEGCPAYGRFGDDPMHNVVGRGTYTTIHGEVRQMYQCNVCEKAFSETAGTPLVSVTTKIIYGSKDVIQAFLEPLGQKINTAFVERVNLTMRHLVSRLHCKTLCFSKKREYLVYHLHLALAYYHFARHHASLRVALPEPLPTRGNGSPKKWQQRTPAMAAGLTDHRWSLRELLMCSVSAAPG